MTNNRLDGASTFRYYYTNVMWPHPNNLIGVTFRKRGYQWKNYENHRRKYTCQYSKLGINCLFIGDSPLIFLVANKALRLLYYSVLRSDILTTSLRTFSFLFHMVSGLSRCHWDIAILTFEVTLHSQNNLNIMLLILLVPIFSGIAGDKKKRARQSKFNEVAFCPL